MWVHRGAAGIEAHAPAKLNLYFEVLAKRSDGYHEIETLMVPVGLYDTLLFSDAPGGRGAPLAVTLRCCGPAAAGIPAGAENIVVRAVELVRQRLGVERGASIRLVKRIPSGGGLGGGSSDAAAALLAANLAWDLRLDRARLGELAAELGSDVPFFLAAGPAICRGRGERIETVEGLGDIAAVVVRPPGGLSTAAVYARCRVPEKRGSPRPLVEALRVGRIAEAGRRLTNRLQAPAAELSPWVGRLEQEFARLDCAGHQLTGSGSCYFGLCRTLAQARHVAGRLAARGVGQTFLVRRAG